MCEFFTLQFWTVVQKPIAETKYYQQKLHMRQEAWEKISIHLIKNTQKLFLNGTFE